MMKSNPISSGFCYFYFSVCIVGPFPSFLHPLVLLLHQNQKLHAVVSETQHVELTGLAACWENVSELACRMATLIFFSFCIPCDLFYYITFPLPLI